VPSVDRYVETWRAFERLYADERVRAIGVSNFTPAHLQRLLRETGVVPAVNQVELHPSFQQAELREFDAKHGIVTEAWSPLGQGAGLSDPAIQRIADTRRRTPAQIVLRWHLDIGNIAIPKSVTPSRINENIEVFDFQLTPDEHRVIAALDRNQRIGPDPDVAGAAPSGFSDKIDPTIARTGP
jgi:2,5-diketo-D-gluconate reductase A